MSDTYDEQIEAILEGNVGRFARAANADERPIEFKMAHEAATLYSAAWETTAAYPRSLFANLPGCTHCASQIQSRANRPAGSKEAEFYQLIRHDNKMVLRNPGRTSKPTREILNEFARRQRLCRTESPDA